MAIRTFSARVIRSDTDSSIVSQMADGKVSVGSIVVKDVDELLCFALSLQGVAEELEQEAKQKAADEAAKPCF